MDDPIVFVACGPLAALPEVLDALPRQAVLALLDDTPLLTARVASREALHVTRRVPDHTLAACPAGRLACEEYDLCWDSEGGAVVYIGAPQSLPGLHPEPVSLSEPRKRKYILWGGPLLKGAPAGAAGSLLYGDLRLPRLLAYDIDPSLTTGPRDPRALRLVVDEYLDPASGAVVLCRVRGIAPTGASGKAAQTTDRPAARRTR